MAESTSAQIRGLHGQGVPTAEIARRLSIRYQFVYGVISRSGDSINTAKRTKQEKREKPFLTADRLKKGGFELITCWQLEKDAVGLGLSLPQKAGVYAFSKDGIVQYVGVATTTLHMRLNFYIKPGSTQTSSIRLNAILLTELKAGSAIEIYAISVTDCFWNGWRIDDNLGLEGGLISQFHLPWNKRGASPFLQE